MTRAHVPPSLTVRCGGDAYTFAADAATVVVGRGDDADVHIGDPRISRAHVRLEVRDNQWFAVDNGSRNGMYADGERCESVAIRSGLTLRVGAPDGVEVSFSCAEEAAAPTEVVRPMRDLEVTLTGHADAGVIRAGAAAAARRRELEITQDDLAKYKVIEEEAFAAFEKGRSWPREQVRAKLEEVLRWPPGTLERIRTGEPVPSSAEAPATRSSPASLIGETVEAAVTLLSIAADALPEISDDDFHERLGGLLVAVRALETVVARAVHENHGNPALALALSAVRRRYDELMWCAAVVPGATLGQRLYAARRRANLTVQEIANAAGLSAELIQAVEAERSVTRADAARLAELVDHLDRSE